MNGDASKPHKAKKSTGVPSSPHNRLTFSGLMRSGRFRFAVAFGLSCLGFHGLLCVLPPPFIEPLCDHTARTLGQFLGALGIPVLAVNNIVSGGPVAFRVVLECTALFMVALFACFVSFYPSDARQKAVGLAMGIPALYLGNLVRLAAIFVVSRYHPGLFDLVHVYLGQVFTMFLVIMSCLLWLKWVNRGPDDGRGNKVAGFLARFALTSGCIFLLWMEIHHGYIRLIDRLMTMGFSLFGYRIFFPPMAAVYYETFSIVTFAALIVSTKSMNRSKKMKSLVAGLGLFFLLHLFHRVDNVLISAFRFTSLFRLDVFMCDVGLYVLPLLLWLAMAGTKSRDLKPSRMGNRRQTNTQKKQPPVRSVAPIRAQ